MAESKPRRVLLYGANGYTARLLLSRLREERYQLVVAGRNASTIERVGAELGLATRVFDLADPHRIDQALRDVTLLVNAAGPFCDTAPPLIDACLRRRVDYADLSGELESISYADRCDSLAKDLDVMLLPAIGFDVAASDCLAVHLSRRMPDARNLTLAISPSNLLSRGSALTMARNAGNWVQRRRDGVLEPIRWRAEMRRFDFGDGEQPSIAVSWGDLVSAFHSTRIPNIDVYFEATAFWLSAMLGNQFLGPAVGSASRPFLERLARALPDGPGLDARKRERCIIVGEVSDGSRRERARLTTTEAYTFTAEIASYVIDAIVNGNRRGGFVTPGVLLGPDLVLRAAGVRRESLS